jgi:hypothetical protein
MIKGAFTVLKTAAFIHPLLPCLLESGEKLNQVVHAF